MLEHSPPRWPDGKHLALYLGLQLDEPHDLEDRGMPGGLWRIAELLEELGMRPSALVTPELCQHHRDVLEMGAERGWTWVVQGENSLRRTFRSVELVTGDRPRGWLKSRGSPDASAAMQLLAELGATYILDPSEGNQPCICRQGHGDLVYVPYTYELDDLLAFSSSGSDGAVFGRMLIDQFDVLYAESHTVPRVMSISVHPSVIGRPFRYKHFAEALRYMAAHEGVWLATTDEIANHYAGFGRARAPAQMFEELPLG